MIAVEWSQGIEDAWSDIASFVPKFIGFLIILLIGYFVAKLIAKAVGAILERVGFDKAVERGGVKKALDRSEVRRLRHRRQDRLLRPVPHRAADGVRRVRRQPDQRPARRRHRLPAQGASPPS